MSVLKRPDAAKPDTKVVGYINVHSGQIVCLEHGERDIHSPRSPWAPVRVPGRVQMRYASTAPVVCHECGAWLNDEATGYAIVSSHDGYWRRRLRHGRGQRED